MSQLADRIKAERRRLGLSQEALADRAHITQGAIQKIEAGRRTPNVVIVADVAVALGVAMDWLVLGEGPKERRAYPLDLDDVRPLAASATETESRSLEDRVTRIEQRLDALLPPLGERLKEDLEIRSGGKADPRKKRQQAR